MSEREIVERPDVAPTPRLLRGVDRLLSVQRPVVLAQLRMIRRSRPDATPAEVLRILERGYLTAITTGGATVGLAASFPVVGTGTSLALSGVETAGFVESTALFAQSVAELHGVSVSDPDRARTLVMTMILGDGGQELLQQLVGQAVGRGGSRNLYWGEMVAKNLPGPVVGMVADRLKQAFMKRFAVTQGGSVIGRTIPFGVGAVIGGAGNNILGRRVVASARSAFGDLPAGFPPDLEDFWKSPRNEQAEPFIQVRAGKRLIYAQIGGRRIPLPVLPMRAVRERVEEGHVRRIRERPRLAPETEGTEGTEAPQAR